MKSISGLFVALAMSVTAFGQTSAPAAPTLTAGAEFKGLRLDWDPVPGATWYQLEYRAHQTGAFVQQGDDFPATATSTQFSFPLHLFDWTYARYRLAACNSAGCSRSAEVSVSNLRRDAVGYFKSSNPQELALFGAAADLSPDGYNLVAAAPRENATETDDFIRGGAAYVFHRGSDGKWFQRGRFDLHHQAFRMEGLHVDVATSGSANTVAVALHQYWPGTVPVDESPTGEVDVYYAKPGSGTYTVKRIPRPDVFAFGTSVALSESGYVLAVGVSDSQAGHAIYKSVNGVWQNVRNLPGRRGGLDDGCGYAVFLSRDGRTIAEQCVTATTPARAYVRVWSGSNWTVRSEITLETSATGDLEWGHEGLAIDATGDTIAVQFRKHDDPNDPTNFNGSAEVRVYKRGAAGYSQVARLTPGAWRTSDRRDEYGRHLAFGGDGHTLAVGDTYDNGTGTGPRAAPLVSGTAQTGAVYVYRLSDTWKLANMVKPNYPPSTSGTYGFGWSPHLSQTGKTLLVAVGFEDSSAQGIDGDWANAGRPASGAAFLY
jgi:hypothetical protein